jgi:hypothetical protein
VKRAVAAAAIAGLLGLGAWQAAEALQDEASPPAATPPAPSPADNAADETPAAAPRAAAPRTDPASRVATPMADRVAVIGVLNKRNGIERDLTMKPGQAMRLGDLIVRLRACETTAPWEPEKLTGAFLQADVHGTDKKWRRIFSGWVFKESPSLNMVQHPVYDVWPKSCTMRHPEIGPDTVAAGSLGGGSRSSAKKSGDAAPTAAQPAPAPAPAPRAPSSNAT